MSEVSIQQGVEQGSRESLSQETARHVADFLAVVRAWRVRKTPRSVWASCVAILFAFVLGWVGGNIRGISDGVLLESSMNAALLGASVEGRERGRDYLGDYFFARAADRLVKQQVASESHGFKDLLWDKSSVLDWTRSLKADNQRRMVSRLAEQRLKYLRPASEETLRELAAAKREWLPAQHAQHYSITALEYSTLLGRTVSAEQLVFDAELRNALGIVRTQQN
jgi:hypothetical protein